MASEKLKLRDFEAKNFRRDYGIVIPGIITATIQPDTQEIWLQIGKLHEGRIELTSGFADIPQDSLRRGPMVERVDGELRPTRRTALWVRMGDIKDVWFYERG